MRRIDAEVCRHTCLKLRCFADTTELKEVLFHFFFPMRVVRPWPRLPREAVAAPSLAGLKARLDGALSNLVWWKMPLLMEGGLEPDDF